MDNLDTQAFCSECGELLRVTAGGDVADCAACGAPGFNLYGSKPRKKRGKRRNKYGNVHTRYDGHAFDSIAEARYYAYLLKPAVEAGEISDLEVHPQFVLQDAFVDAAGTAWPAITYESDFRYIKDGRTVVVDVKGVPTPKFKIQELLFRKRFPSIEFIVAYSQ